MKTNKWNLQIFIIISIVISISATKNHSFSLIKNCTMTISFLIQCSDYSPCFSTSVKNYVVLTKCKCKKINKIGVYEVFSWKKLSLRIKCLFVAHPANFYIQMQFYNTGQTNIQPLHLCHIQKWLPNHQNIWLYIQERYKHFVYNIYNGNWNISVYLQMF